MEVIDKTIKKVEKVTLTTDEQIMLRKILTAVEEFTASGFNDYETDTDMLDNLNDLAYIGVIEQECD